MKICDLFKKRKIIPQKPKSKKKKGFMNKKRNIIERKKSRLQIRTGKDLKIIPIEYKGKLKNVYPI